MAHVGERRRRDFKDIAGQPDRAPEGLFRRFKTRPGAAGAQHAFVKTRVMRREEFSPLEKNGQLRPELFKGRRVFHVRPAYAVQFGKEKGLPGWPDEAVRAPDYLVVLHADQPHRTGGIPAVIGCFKINRRENRHVYKYPSGKLIKNFKLDLTPLSIIGLNLSRIHAPCGI